LSLLKAKKLIIYGGLNEFKKTVSSSGIPPEAEYRNKLIEYNHGFFDRGDHGDIEEIPQMRAIDFFLRVLRDSGFRKKVNI